MNWLAIGLVAIGGMLAIEGAAWAIFPAQMLRMYKEAFEMGERALHVAGLVSVALGVSMIMIAVKTSV